MWREVTRIQICETLNHRKKMKGEPSRLIPPKPTGNLERLIALGCYAILTFDIFIISLVLDRKLLYHSSVPRKSGFVRQNTLFVFATCQSQKFTLVSKSEV